MYIPKNCHLFLIEECKECEMRIIVCIRRNASCRRGWKGLALQKNYRDADERGMPGYRQILPEDWGRQKAPSGGVRYPELEVLQGDAEVQGV